MPKRLPAEWEKHEAVWIAWPHEESDFPGVLELVRQCYLEFIPLLAQSEHVNLIVPTSHDAKELHAKLRANKVTAENLSLHCIPSDRSWLRDSAPTSVVAEDGSIEWIAWQFNAWAKYENFSLDAALPEHIASLSKLRMQRAQQVNSEKPLVLEGGAFESDGAGTLMVTEECLLSEVQERNPGLDRASYEQAFKQYLGIEKTLWLAGGCEGDDTHGHIDDVARFAPNATVLLAVEDDASDSNYAVTQENLQRLQGCTNAKGNELAVVKLPFPKARYFEGQRLPASYANYYVSNSNLLVPTFDDAMDARALKIIAQAHPDKKIIGVYCGDLVVGQGTLHCLSQPQFASQN